MRWNKEFYTGDSTPFLSKHRCSETAFSCNARSFNKYYVPLKNVQVGDLAVAFCGLTSIFGEVKATKRKGRKTYVAFNDKPNKLYLISKCVALPVVNEFVRHKQSKRWYKVISVSEVGTLKIKSVLNMPEENAADKSADAADKSENATDKSENAADKSADAAKKSDADKSENAADKSADAAADKADADKSENAADKSADAAADKADADTAAEKSEKSDKSADNRLPVESARAAHAAAGRAVLDAAAGRDIAHKSASMEAKKKKAEARKKARKSFGAAGEYGEVFWS